MGNIVKAILSSLLLLNSSMVNDSNWKYTIYEDSSKILEEYKDRTGWSKSKDNRYRYILNGEIQKNIWVASKNRWYYMDNNGYMVTEPTVINGKMEYFKKDGVWFRGISDINIHIEDGANAEDIKIYLEALEKLPDFLKYNITDIIITPDNLEQRFNVSRTGTIVGVTHDWTYITLRTGTGFDIDWVLKHEALHVYEGIVNQKNYGYKIADKVTESEEWNTLIDKEGQNISTSLWNIRDSGEIFVAASFKFLEEPEELKKSAPNIYEFLKDKVFIHMKH